MGREPGEPGWAPSATEQVTRAGLDPRACCLTLVYLGMYLFAVIDGVFPPIPSESLAIALAALSASTGQPNLALIIASAATGAFTGDQIAYTIGKRLDVRRIPFIRGPRGQKALNWAGRSLELRGGIGHPRRTLHPGRAGRREHDRWCGAVRYPRRRFVGFDAIASLTWALYSAAIGIGAGEWFKGHPLGAVLVGLAGGMLIGLVLDWTLRRLARRRNQAGDPATIPAAPRGPTRRRQK